MLLIGFADICNKIVQYFVLMYLNNTFIFHILDIAFQQIVKNTLSEWFWILLN